MIFKVWSQKRDKKTLICIADDNEDIYTALILKASLKLDVDGSQLVLESDGTHVDEETLLHVQNETLILLAKNCEWENDKVAFASTSSLPTTISNSSCDDSSISSKDIHYTIDCNSEYFWHTFEVPWEYLEPEYIKDLQQNKRSKILTCRLVHLVVKKMREFKTTIPIKAFKVIANKIIEKYPDVFKDVDEDGVVLGDGTHSLVSKLQDRSNYLNRPHKLNKQNQNLQSPVATKRRYLSARAGCSNWNPDLPTTDTHINKNTDINDENLIQIMETTYAKQRRFLNQNPPPTIPQIQEEWPILCSAKGLFQHFNMLTNSDIHLLNEIDNKTSNIVHYLNTKHQEASEDQEVSSHAQQFLKMLSVHFREELVALVLSYKSTSDIISNQLPVTPTVVQIGDEFKADLYYIVYVEQIPINSDGYSTFLEAFKIAFCLYFVLNLKYPKRMCVCLELIQRYFLKIHPDAGSKCCKTNATKKKVFNFLNKLRDLRDL